MDTPGSPLRVLAFEGWDAGSHRQVRDCLTRHSRHDWTWVTRPGRSWKWRMRTGAVELVDQADRDGLLKEPPDVIFATSMVAAGDLKALLPYTISGRPIVLYMHENQAAYPFQHDAVHEEERDHQFALTNLTSVLASDRVLWNSQWNLDSFCSAINSLLSKAPDGQLKSAEERTRARSLVAWPPVERPDGLNADAGVLHNTIQTGNASGDSGRPTRIIWPHRWEHDKGPDELYGIAEELERSEPGRYRWTLLGEQFGTVPDDLTRFQADFGHLIDHAGYVPSREDYWSHLRGSDWVLSTARHEFFGIAVVEAMLAGCLPWLPDRLSYPEITPASAHGLRPGQGVSNEQAVREAIASHLAATEPSIAVGTIDSQLEAIAGGNHRS